MTADALAMLGALSPAMPADERAIVCGFRGDPAVVRASAWRPRPWRPGARLPFTAQDNAYVCVSSFRVAPDGTWRRRREGFAAAWALAAGCGASTPGSTFGKSTTVRAGWFR